MASVLPFIPHEVTFDAESLARVGSAFDQACAQLQADKQTPEFKEELAARIIALARTGKIDPDWLCNVAVKTMTEGFKIAPKRKGILFKCPKTGLNVQGLVSDDGELPDKDIRVPVECAACGGIHLLNPKVGTSRSITSSK